MVNGKQGTWQNVCTVKLDKESFMHCKESLECGVQKKDNDKEGWVDTTTGAGYHNHLSKCNMTHNV